MVFNPLKWYHTQMIHKDLDSIRKHTEKLRKRRLITAEQKEQLLIRIIDIRNVLRGMDYGGDHD